MKKLACIPMIMVGVLMSVVFPTAAEDITPENKVKAKPPKVQVTEKNEFYMLTFAPSKIFLVVPKNGLLPASFGGGGGMDNPGYFSMQDKKAGVILSGWFEPESSYKGITSLWQGEITSWSKRGLPNPIDVSMVKIGIWDSVLYDISLPSPKVNNCHIRASAVKDGTWIDIHLSVTSDRPASELRAYLVKLLKTIQIFGKKQST